MIDIQAYKEKIESRVETCNACPHKEGNRCGICGCFLSLKSLAFWTHCPDNRWEQ